jgi:DNA mismatch repair protein MutS2
LTLLGMRVAEALEAADKYLDDAVLAGLEQVTLIHGKGTGAVRQGLHELLRDHPHVAGFRLGALDEGGAGITVVSLRG